MSRPLLLLPPLLLIATLLATPAVGAQPLVAITSPPDGTTVAVPEVTITGTAPAAAAAGTVVVYAVDVSGSTLEPLHQDCDGDGVSGTTSPESAEQADPDDNYNGDFWPGDTLDCEISGVLALNHSLSGTETRVGLVPFADAAVAADVGVDAGIQTLVGVDTDADRDGQGTPDIETVTRSMFASGIRKYEPHEFSGGTDFEPPLRASADIFDGDGGAAERVVHFLTDGDSIIEADTSEGLARLRGLGAVVHTYAIGANAQPCTREDGSLTPIGLIADRTGGRCTVIPDPASLRATLGNEGTPASTERVELLLNGVEHPVARQGDTWSVHLTGLQVGRNEVLATGYGPDGSFSTAGVVVFYDPEATPDDDFVPPAGTSRVVDDVGGAPVDLGASVCELAIGDDAAASVLLSRDDAFADALAGAPLAGDDSCILYTPGGPDQVLAPSTAAEIDRVLPPGGLVRILGGVNAVSDAVEHELRAAGYEVVRYAGASRFQTAVLLAIAVFEERPVLQGYEQAYLLANAYNWPDATTGGAFGAATGVPILLTDVGSLHPDTASALDAMGLVEGIVLGGEAVISAPVVSDLSSRGPVQRVAGSTRMQTAAEVAADLWAASGLSQLDRFLVVNLGDYGDGQQGWPISLAAAPLSAGLGAPQLGVYADSYPTETEQFLRDVVGVTDELPAVALLGGVGIIQAAVEEAVEATIGG